MILAAAYVLLGVSCECSLKTRFITFVLWSYQLFIGFIHPFQSTDGYPDNRLPALSEKSYSLQSLGLAGTYG